MEWNILKLMENVYIKWNGTNVKIYAPHIKQSSLLSSEQTRADFW